MSKSINTNLAIEVPIENIVGVKQLLKLRKGAKVFSQGAPADSVFFIHSGKVGVTVVSAYGKSVELAVLGPGDFLGEGCLVDDSLRTTTARSLEPSTVFRVGKKAMLNSLRLKPEFSAMFLDLMLTRNIGLEAALSHQLFNHSERRLGRLLLKLSYARRHQKLPNATIARVSHKVLAEIVGTSSSKIALLMNRFRTRGLIAYQGRSNITVMDELLTRAVLASELNSPL